MSETPLLGLPLLAASQAQKHVTHNEALGLLDAFSQLAVASRALASPPASPADGDRYLVATGASGDWTGEEGKVALRFSGGWRFMAPRTGWRMYVVDEAKLLVFDGTAWADTLTVPDLQNLPHAGINTTADTTNRLAVSADASLFTHAGTDHRMKVNKNGSGDTAALLFQTAYSGRAEMGLAGDDNFHIKVSPDGTAWQEALTVNATSGAVSLPATRLANGTLADMPATSLKGNAGAVPAAPADLTPAQARTLLGLSDQATLVLGLGLLATIPAVNRTARTLAFDFVNDLGVDVSPSSGPSFSSALAYPGATFTRSSAAVLQGLKGQVSAVAANVPRLAYGSDGGACGLLVEAAATNIVLQSCNLAISPWTADNGGATNPVRTANYAAAPDGTMTATRLQLNKTGGTFSRVQQNSGSGGGAVYTLSAWMKAVSGGVSNVGLRLDGTGINCVVNGNWQRFTLTANSSTLASQVLLFDSIAGNDETADILVWGVQLESGGAASSFIQTTTTTASRAVERMDMPVAGTSLDSVSLFADFIVPALPNDGISRTIACLWASATDRMILTLTGAATPSLSGTISCGGVSKSITLVSNMSAYVGSRMRAALALDTITGRSRGKATGVAAPAENTTMPGAPGAPSSLHIGHENGASAARTGIVAAGFSSRAWSPSEIAAYTG
jgi:hypothetical protein